MQPPHPSDATIIAGRASCSCGGTEPEWLPQQHRLHPSWPDQKETNLKDLKLKDLTLTFSAVREFMGNEIAIEYKLTIDGNKLKGKGAAEFGGQKQEFDIEGKRQKKDK
jgi:hypothetical protein